MNTQEHHLIFGTGPIGKAIATELHKQGKTITMVNRSGKADVASGITVVAGDASNETFTREIAQGKSYIYNATNPAYTEWAEKFPPLNTSILKAATSAKARLIVMDNLYMYGDTQGKPLHEGLPYLAKGVKGTTRAKMATELLQAHQRGDVQVTIGRASDFFGPGVTDSSMGRTVFENMLAGKPAQILGNIDKPHTQSYVPDVGRALVTLAQNDKAYGKAWHLPNAETITTHQFLQIVADELGQPLKVQALGKFMVNVLGLFIPVLRESREMMYEFTQDFVVDDSAFKQAFGGQATPLKQAIRETVVWYKANKA
jgi:nucleoside-diphosphate-sugar epimerase